ncbi:hypothetical protein ABZ791_02140 [Streptomyces huasconensis]|uniref:Uncharacterized protein n=1 Tax=Streptomyces huasconensis TaxID=1854574 RepID=A0ABV3LRJ8_9ACTN
MPKEQEAVAGDTLIADAPRESDAATGPASREELFQFVDRYGDLIDDRVAEIIDEAVEEAITARAARLRCLSWARLCVVVAALCGVSVLLRETPYAVAPSARGTRRLSRPSSRRPHRVHPRRSYGDSTAGSITSVSSRPASARRSAEKSTATTGPYPCALSTATTPRPMGPSPNTTGTSPGATPERRTGRAATEKGSVSAATSAGSLPGTAMVNAYGRLMYSPKPPGERRPRCSWHGTEHGPRSAPISRVASRASGLHGGLAAHSADGVEDTAVEDGVHDAVTLRPW